MAEGAWRHDCVGAGLLRLLDGLDQLTERRVLARLDDREAAALDLRRVVDRLAAAGGDILFGTDVGFADVADTREEMWLLGQALNWREILAAMTTTPARRFRQSEVRGIIAPGFVADLVALDGDPTEGLESRRRVAMVWREGRVVYCSDAPD